MNMKWLPAAFSEMAPATRRAAFFTFGSLLALLVVYAFSLATLESQTLPRMLSIAIALLPALPFFAVVSGFVRIYRSSDELYRGVQSQGMMWGFVFALIVSVVWSLLDLGGATPHFRPMFAAIALGLGFIAGVSAAKAKYE